APVHVVWIRRNGSFKLGYRRVVLALPQENMSQDGMSQGQIFIELNGLASTLVCPVEDTGVEMIAIQGVHPRRLVCARQERVGTGVVWINGTRELKETPRFVKRVHAEGGVKRDKDFSRLQTIV